MDVRRAKANRARQQHIYRQQVLDEAIAANVHSLLGLLQERTRMTNGPLPNSTRQLRTEAAKTAEQVAEALGMSLRQYLRIEKGGSTSIARMRQIAAYFGLPVHEVFDLNDEVVA